MTATTPNQKRTAFGLAKGTVSGLSGLIAAICVGFGIPLLWVWIASQLAGTTREITPSLAILITTGILVSYWLALLTGSFIRGRLVDEDAERAKLRRMSWNRSFRDEPLKTDKESDPVERVFVIVAVVGVIAFEVWFFFFAGSPLPSQPMF